MKNNIFKMELGEMNNNQFTMFCLAEAFVLFAAAFMAHGIAAMILGAPFVAHTAAIHSLAVSVPLTVITMGAFGMERFVELDRDPHPHAAKC